MAEMDERQVLCAGVGRAAWGYFFLLFNIEINGLNLLPYFVGYCLLLTALERLTAQKLWQSRQRNLGLLRPLCLLLIVYYLLNWFGKLDMIPGLLFVNLLVTAAEVYFHFQFLTDMAALTAELQPAETALTERLLRWRSVFVLVQTVLFVSTQFWDWQMGWLVWLLALLIIIGLVAEFIIMLALFDLRKLLRQEV